MEALVNFNISNAPIRGNLDLLAPSLPVTYPELISIKIDTVCATVK